MIRTLLTLAAGIGVEVAVTFAADHDHHKAVKVTQLLMVSASSVRSNHGSREGSSSLSQRSGVTLVAWQTAMAMPCSCRSRSPHAGSGSRSPSSRDRSRKQRDSYSGEDGAG